MPTPVDSASFAALVVRMNAILDEQRALGTDGLGLTTTGALALSEATAAEVAGATELLGIVADAGTGLLTLKRFTAALAGGSGGGGGTTPDPGRINISGIRTAGNLSAYLASVTPGGMIFQPNPTASRIVNIDAGTEYQEFLGAGASLTESACYNLMAHLSTAQRTAILTEMFGTNGQSTTRICLGDSDFCIQTPGVRAGTASFRTYDDSGATDLSGFSFAKDLTYVVPVLQQARAINPDLVIIATPWTPPVAFKSAGATLTTGTMNESSANLHAYAAYIVKALQAFASHDLPIDFVTIQNEIGRLGDTGLVNPFPACQWTVAGSTAFIGILGAAIAAATSPTLTTQILAGDDSVSTAYVADAFNDTTAAGYLAGSAVHAYNESLYNFPNHLGAGSDKPWHMTEISSYSPDPNISIRYYASGIIMPTLRSGGSSITLWNAFLDQDGQPGITSNVPPMIVVASSGSGALTKRVDYYMVSQVTRAVKRGARRIDSTTFAQSTSYTATGSDVETVAFKNPDGSIAVLLWNGASTAQTVYLRDVVGGGVGTMITVPARDFQSYVFRNSAKVNVPDAPQINATFNSGVVAVSLKADAPCNNGGAITGYDLFVGASAGYAGTKVAANVSLPHPISFTSGGQPHVYAQAVNSAGNSANGNEVAATSAVTTDLSLVQAAGAHGSGTAPSISLSAAAASANTVIVVYSGDTDLTGPSGATKLFSTNDASGVFFAAWSVPGYILASGTTFTLSGGTPFGWQLAAYEVANVSRIALSTHGTASQYANIAYWQPSQSPAGNAIRVVAAAWNAGGAPTPVTGQTSAATASVSGGSQGTNGIIIDSAGAGGLAGTDYYHGGIMFRIPSSVTGEDYLNVTAAVSYDRSAYAEVRVT